MFQQDISVKFDCTHIHVQKYMYDTTDYIHPGNRQHFPMPMSFWYTRENVSLETRPTSIVNVRLGVYTTKSSGYLISLTFVCSIHAH